jgi:hypothetical protein
LHLLLSLRLTTMDGDLKKSDLRTGCPIYHFGHLGVCPRSINPVPWGFLINEYLRQWKQSSILLLKCCWPWLLRRGLTWFALFFGDYIDQSLWILW